ncbi:MAG: PEP-CTERM sorting domain-containing protein [Sedimentisphaerales bacterium]|nr:PEP-CTERM sorting domain-containing protein [Sedimentisphaerales bacterium]
MKKQRTTKTIVCIVAIVGFFVPVANGTIQGNYSTYQILGGNSVTAAPIAIDNQGAGPVYSNMNEGGGWYSISNTEGVIAYDDYDSINDADIEMDKVRFIGGVQNAGEVIWFDFFESDHVTYVDGFGVQFPVGGNYIWTITLGSPITVRDAGVLQLEADPGYVTPSTGVWFLSDAAPTIGSEDPTWPGYTDSQDEYLSCKFEINNVPEPCTMALLGLGGMAAIRRRKK